MVRYVSYLQDELVTCSLGTQIASSLCEDPGLTISVYAEAVGVKGVGVVRRTENILEKGQGISWKTWLLECMVVERGEVGERGERDSRGYKPPHLINTKRVDLRECVCITRPRCNFSL